MIITRVLKKGSEKHVISPLHIMPPTSNARKRKANVMLLNSASKSSRKSLPDKVSCKIAVIVNFVHLAE